MYDSRATILVAEDEPIIRNLLNLILTKSGYNVLSATDGQEALQIASEHDYGIDMLVSDIQMPGMTGVELAKELERFRPNLPILLMSGFSQGMLILETGWSFLEKPFFPSAMLQKVSESLHAAVHI